MATSNTTSSNNIPSGLNDTQKSDLALIWNSHSIVIILDGNDGKNYQDGSSTSTSDMSVPLDNQCYTFIASLTSYFIHVLNHAIQEKFHFYSNNQNDSNQKRRFRSDGRYDTTLEALKTYFPRIDEIHYHNIPSSTSTSSSTNNNTLISSILTPIIPHGKQIINIDHSSFINESKSYNNCLSDFGAFLYHRPQYGLCSINSAIALCIMTLHRRSSLTSSQTQTQLLLQNNIIINPQLINIHTRFHNVYPTIQIHDVKTSNAYKFITLKGRIIKVYSKRLRLVSADVLCIKCGYHFHHLFCNGRYELPTKCRAIPTSTTTNQKQQKCRGQKFELVRRTAKYIDYQKLKLQEEDNHYHSNSNMGKNNSNGNNNHNSTSAPSTSTAASSSSSGAAGATTTSPRSIDLEVTGDLVDICHAGDCVKVVGTIHALNTAIASGKFGRRASETSTYTLYMIANSIVNTTADLHGHNTKKDSSRGGLAFSKDQLEKIIKVAHADPMMGTMSVRMAFPFDLLVRSLCPSIIGHDCVKAGILLGLLGGTPPSSSGLEDVKCGLTIRSNIHVLIVGDPGMGKSCLLLASQQVAARSVYVGGNTSSTTGLTVSLSKEPGGEVGIEAGALVLADQGVCCIDEFDKMAKSNQDGLLEAMEQQQISIAKAGAIASLPSRCAIIAAANPKQGKYNLNKTVAENLNISPPLLSRFDLVFILRDDADIDHDKLISGNIMNMYKSINDVQNPQKKTKRQKIDEDDQFHVKRRLPWVAQTQNPLPADLLRDYISYAREYCKPKLTQEAAAVLKNYFLTLRYPEDGSSRHDSVPITTRQLEALIRLSQARAKACMREFVLKEDAEDVVELMRESVNQVHMDSNGILDKTRGGVVGKSKRKQKKAFIDTLRKRGQNRFTKDDFYAISHQLDLPLNDFWTLVDELRYSDQPEIRKGGDGFYYLL